MAPGPGVQQRTMLVTLADRGTWHPDCGWGQTAWTRKVLAGLERRGLVERYGDSATARPQPWYRVSAAGYRCLIRQVLADLDGLDPRSQVVYGRLLDRITQLSRMAALALVHPVDWAGRRAG